ncbi:hypothetical protein BDF14DRAFT_1878415 [Spinellus fusiger]|nr:hypothetical protein BDF14DRAFT_1878415 [Spinellus fusiger]
MNNHKEQQQQDSVSITHVYAIADLTMDEALPTPTQDTHTRASPPPPPPPPPTHHTPAKAKTQLPKRKLRERKTVQIKPFTVDSSYYNSLVDHIVTSAPRPEEERRALQSYNRLHKKHITIKDKYEEESEAESEAKDEAYEAEEEYRKEERSYKETEKDQVMYVEDSDPDTSYHLEDIHSSQNSPQKNSPQNTSFSSFDCPLLPDNRPTPKLPTTITYKRKGRNKHGKAIRIPLASLSSILPSFQESSFHSSPMHENSSSQNSHSQFEYNFSQPLTPYEENEEEYSQIPLNRSGHRRRKRIVIPDSDQEDTTSSEESGSDIFAFPSHPIHQPLKSIRMHTQTTSEKTQDEIPEEPSSLVLGSVREGIHRKLYKKQTLNASSSSSGKQDGFVVEDDATLNDKEARIKLPTLDELRHRKKFMRGILPLSFAKVFGQELEEEKNLRAMYGGRLNAPEPKENKVTPKPILQQQNDPSLSLDRKTAAATFNDMQMLFSDSSETDDGMEDSTLEDAGDVVEGISQRPKYSSTHPSNEPSNHPPRQRLRILEELERDMMLSEASHRNFMALEASQGGFQSQRLSLKRKRKEKTSNKSQKTSKHTIPLPSASCSNKKRERERMTVLSAQIHSIHIHDLMCKVETTSLEEKNKIDMHSTALSLKSYTTEPWATVFHRKLKEEETLEETFSSLEKSFWQVFQHMARAWHGSDVYTDTASLSECIHFYKCISLCLGEWVPRMERQKQEKALVFFRTQIECLCYRIFKLSGSGLRENMEEDLLVRFVSGAWKPLILLLLFTLDWLFCLSQLESFPTAHESVNSETCARHLLWILFVLGPEKTLVQIDEVLPSSTNPTTVNAWIHWAPKVYLDMQEDALK